MTTETLIAENLPKNPSGPSDIIVENLNKLKGMPEWGSKESKTHIKTICDVYSKYRTFKSRKESVDTFVKEDGTELFMKILNHLIAKGIFSNDDVWFSCYYIYNTWWNYTDVRGTKLPERCCEVGLITHALGNITHQPYKESYINSKNILYIIKSSISILHNIARFPEMLHYFKPHNTVDALKYYVDSKNDFIKAISILTLAYLVNEDQNDIIMDSTGTIKFIVHHLIAALNSPKRRSRGFSPLELAQGIERLAVNDSNKISIVKEGALPYFISMLNGTNLSEQRSAASALWTLSFDPKVREAIQDTPGSIEALEKVASSSNLDNQKAAKGALWVIKKEERPHSTENQLKSKTKHIMISYQWGNQPVVIKLRDALERAGYCVWLDIDRMGGSTLEAMANAVENAAVVLMCLSEKYKLSPNCRTEAEYTFQLRKEIIPLMMEQYYQPDGWLGILVGAKLYIDFAKLPFKEQVPKLLKQLNEKGKVGSGDKVVADVVDGGDKPHRPLPMTDSKQVLKWKEKEVSKWLGDNGLEHCRVLFKGFGGSHLLRLQRIRSEAPEFFYNSLKQDLGLKGMLDIVTFVDALDNLLS